MNAQPDTVIVSSNTTWRGAGQIARNVLGEDTPLNRKRIYNWLGRRAYPHRPVTYRFGSVLCMDAKDYFDWLAQTKFGGAARGVRRKIDVTAANEGREPDESAA